MTARSPANKLWLCFTCLLAGCTQSADTTPSGPVASSTFGQRRSNVLDAATPERSHRGNDAAPTTAVAPTNAVNPEAVLTSPEEPTTATMATEVADGSASDASGYDTSGYDASGYHATVDAVATSSAGLAANADLPSHTGRDERTLRNAFANATDPTQAGLELAGFLVQQERQSDALFVIDTALKQKRTDNQADTVPLRLARAGLLRDVARCDLAVTELRGVVQELGAKRVSPATLLDLAQAEWVTGDNQAASATLQTLHREHANDDWVGENAHELATWRQRFEAVRPGRDPLANGELRDMYALLRAAPDYSARLRMLNSLARPDFEAINDAGGIDARRPLRLRAIAIACADDAASVRARAVQWAAANQLTDMLFWTTALRDVAPVVRNFAATGITRMHGKLAASELLQAIAREQDHAAFLSMHAALSKSLGVAAKPCDAATDAGRQAAVTVWKAICEQ